MFARFRSAGDAVFRRGRFEKAMTGEIYAHLEERADELVHAGMPRGEVVRVARVEFGGIERVKDECREARGMRMTNELWQDLRYAVRQLKSNPGFTAAAVLTLGLGIGAEHRHLQRRQRRAAQAAAVCKRRSPGAHSAVGGARGPARHRRVDQGAVRLPGAGAGFEGLVEHHQMSFDLLNRGEPDRVSTGVVSHNFFDVLGIRTIAGRTFVETDDLPGAPAVLVLSYSYWRQKFGGDPAIVGHVFQMNDRPHTVVGILPNVPHYPVEEDVYMSVSACPFRTAAEKTIAQNRRAFSNLVVFGHLKPDVSPARAAGDIDVICRRFVADTPAAYRPGSGFTATTLNVQDEMTKNAGPMRSSCSGPPV